MKKLFFLLAFSINLQAIQAQQPPCNPSLSQISLEGNGIRARILNNGSLFTDGFNGQFLPNPLPALPTASTISEAKLWIGGLDPAGNLILSTGNYVAGPLDDDGSTNNINCAKWDRHFKVLGADVAAFLVDLPTLAGNPAAAITQHKSIMGWPGHQNPYFSDVWGFDLPNNQYRLAPFFDYNTDGVYNPLQGDYPAVALQDVPPFVPTEFVWSVFNDINNTSPFQMEMHQMAWAFNCPDKPILNRTVFTSHKLIYKGSYPIDSCSIAMWVDFDLGCFADDYVGSVPDLGAFFVYNQDMTDGQPGAACEQGVITFADNPPVQSATFLSQPLDKFMYYNNFSVGNPLFATSDPSTTIEFYRYLTGSWKDGYPLTAGGSGYNPNGTPADYAFPSNPENPNGWSMCASNLPLGDRRALGIHQINTLSPGQITELVIAWTTHLQPNLPCGLGPTFNEIASVRAEYTNDFAGVCSALTTAPDLVAAEIEVFPNPTTQSVTLQFGDLPIREIRLFAADGRQVLCLQNIQNEQTVLDVSNFGNGLYTLQLLSERGIATKKISVLK